MLFNIVSPSGNTPREKDSNFKEYMAYIKNAYWPEREYKKFFDELPEWQRKQPEDKTITEINVALQKISRIICDQRGLYTVASPRGGGPPPLKLPFVNYFHQLFLKRKYDAPMRDPQTDMEELIRLDRKENGEGNYSKNIGNYNHFINVVMAAARLVQYFKDIARCCIPFNHPTMEDMQETKIISKTLAYGNTPSIRSFKLMLAAFYHDLGKAVVDHRHGMEGAFIIADHTTQSLYQLNDITKRYNDHYEWQRDDLLEISDFLYYHDLFGTLGTGESNYIPLADAVDRIKRYSHKHIGKPKKQKDYCIKALFDLWLLNLADIIVSIRNKWDCQITWYSWAKSEEVIEKFLKSEEGANRVHDLRIGLILLEAHNARSHTDDSQGLELLAQEKSRHHVVERVRRLVCASLKPALITFLEDPQRNTSKMKQIVCQLLRNNQGTYELLIPKGEMSAIVFRCIHSLNDSREFGRRFSWIGCMDYSLGFFQKIAERALNKVEEELHTENFKTGWIHDKKDLSLDQGYLDRTNAMFFVDNFTSTVVRILGYLLFRERAIDKPCNIEFEDTRNRLTNEKIDKIITLEGPYRSSRSIELILKTIFVY